MLIIWLAIGIIAFWLVFLALPAFVVYRVTFARRGSGRFKAYHLDKAYFVPYEQRMKDGLKFLKTQSCSRAEIKSFDGIKLCAEYYDTGADRTAILMHGYSALPMTNFCVIAAELIRQGFNVLLPYERAHAGSGGDKCTLGLLESRDLLEWIKWCGAPDIMLYGISMGGAAIAYAADKLYDTPVKLAVIDCAFASPYGQMAYDANKRHIPAPLIIPLVRFLAKLCLGVDIKTSVRESLREASVPVLFLHGDHDSTVPVQVGRKNFEACGSDKLMLIGHGAEHTMSYLALDEEELAQMTAFISKYI